MTEEAPDDVAPAEPPVSKDLVKYYTNKKVRQTSTALETIFEETEEEVPDGCSKMSRRKFRRAINFSTQPASKGRWGVKKANKKKSKRGKRFKKTLKKVTEEVLMEKLAEIERVEED